jgi:branched-chain amino acid transport system substrate-binding protein
MAKRSIPAVLMLAAGLLAAPAARAADEPLRVAVVSFLTGGGAATTGVPIRDAADMVIRAINEGRLPAPYQKPGFGGWEVEPIFNDENGGTARVVQELRALVQRRNVKAVFGYVSSGDALAAAPVAEELKTTLVISEGGTPQLFEERGYDYVFRPTAHGTITAVGAAHYIKDTMPKLKSYAGVNQNYSWGQDSWRDFTLAMKKLMPGVQAKTGHFPKLFQGQYASEITALMGEEPELVFSSFWGGDLESFLAQASGRGLNERSKTVYTIAEISLFRMADKFAPGSVLGARGPYGVLARDTELNRWFVKNYGEAFEKKPSYPAYHIAQSILAYKVAADKAAEKLGRKPTAEEIRAAMVGIEFESFSTRVKMSLGNGHQAATEAAFGQFKLDPVKGPTLENIRYYPADCVNPPPNMTSKQWLEAGMPGAKC